MNGQILNATKRGVYTYNTPIISTLSYKPVIGNTSYLAELWAKNTISIISNIDANIIYFNIIAIGFA